MPSPFVELEVGSRVVKVTNPDKVYFPARGETKLDLVRYFVAVGSPRASAAR
jgi:DNA primase